MKYSQLPVLVVPVFRGGEYFKECLDSLVSCSHCFAAIVISINGKEGMADFMEVQGRLLGDHVYVLKTNRDFNPCEHGKYISDFVKEKFDPKQDLFFLCHDDLLCSDVVVSVSQSPSWKSQDKCIYIGDYNLFGDLCSDVLGTTFIGPRTNDLGCSVTDWYDSLFMNSGAFTSVSGMRVSSKVFTETTEFMWRTKMKKGFRTEYALIAHKDNKYVFRYCQPLVSIRCHPRQEGRALAKIDRTLDELRFCLWYYINARDIKTFLSRTKGALGLSHFIRHLMLALFFQIKSCLSPQ